MAKAPETKTPETPGPMRLWDTLGKTDPSETKPITGKPFKGTAIKPMWVNKRLTETFGPAGIGWGTERPMFEVVESQDELLVFCTVAGWYEDPETKRRGTVFGVGGDTVAVHQGQGDKRRLFRDDEAFKKAYTDAIGNAFKFVGIAADIHMGLFDDSKYVSNLKREFAAEADELGKKVDALQDQIREETDLAKLKELIPLLQDISGQLIEADRGNEQQMLASVFNARTAKLKQDSKQPAEALAGEPTEPADQS